MKKCVCKYLRKNPQFTEKYNLYFDYYGVVMDVRSVGLPFYKHDDGWYLHGEPSGFACLKLSDLDIPEDSYVMNRSNEHLCENSRDFNQEDIDKILFVVDGVFSDDKSYCYADDVLGAKYYLDVNDYDVKSCCCVCLHDWSDESLDAGFADIQAFGLVYDDVKNHLVKNEFPYEPSWTNGFQRLLMLSAMPLKAFCKYFHINRSTAENWKYGISPCPVYVQELIEYKLLHEGII